jgi:CBS domain-containing protein
MDQEIRQSLNTINKTIEPLGATALLTGILPTLRKYDMEMHNLMPRRRYTALMKAIKEQMIGTTTELNVMGIDELIVKHNTPFIEAMNTSFQVHLQVPPKEFAKMHNISQMLAGPILSTAANSPLAFGRRLWHETRIAIFQQAIDTRSSHEHMRERRPRVSFGTGWLNDSILEYYHEDIARFRVWVSGDEDEDSLQLIKQGKVPKLRALQVHNSTVYRWNRACYGISENGKPHLRIENRVLPSGPTVQDEMANSALWLGAMMGYADRYEDIRNYIKWVDVRDNFRKAARYGNDTKFTWFKDQKITAADLMREEIIPMARHGLEKMKVDSSDIDQYMGIIEARTKAHVTGARWILRAYSDLIEKIPRDEAASVLTASILKNQISHLPVHEWDIPNVEDLVEYHPSQIRVEEFMTTDLFTVHAEDLIELVADMMNWRRIRYMPVEDKEGKLVGLISSRVLLKHFVKQRKNKSTRTFVASDIMTTEVITIDPNSTILQAMNIMRENKIGCLPVIKDEELIGIITDMDFLRISSRLVRKIENSD